MFDEQYWAEQRKRSFDEVGRTKPIGKKTILALAEGCSFGVCGPFAIGIWYWGDSPAELGTALAATHYREILTSVLGLDHSYDEMVRDSGLTFSELGAFVLEQCDEEDRGSVAEFVRFMTETFIPAAEEVKTIRDLRKLVDKADDISRAFPLTSAVTPFGGYQTAIRRLKLLSDDEHRNGEPVAPLSGEDLRQLFLESAFA